MSVGSAESTSLEFEPRAKDEPMNRADVTELRYTTAIASVTSILQNGRQKGAVGGT